MQLSDWLKIYVVMAHLGVTMTFLDTSVFQLKKLQHKQRFAFLFGVSKINFRVTQHQTI